MPISYYNSKHDISYAKFNNSNIPWKLNTSYINQSNPISVTNPISANIVQYFGNINNNLVIESSSNDIVFVIPQNKRVVAKNNISINTNLDVSNNLNTSSINVKDISLNRIFNFLQSNGSHNIVGDFNLDGNISIGNIKRDYDGEESKTLFSDIILSKKVIIFDVSIDNCHILSSDFSNVNIKNSYISNIPFGYDKSNNIAPNKAIFTDVSLNNLILNSNSQGTIKFNSDSNSIIIQNSNDHSKLEISTPLIVGSQSINTNISNISIFNGDISCNTLYYQHLNPDIRLNKFFDISISNISISGNIIPTTNNNFNIGASDHTFNNIYSSVFNGYLDGSCTHALDLVKNLDMSFNNLDISGLVRLNGQSLDIYLTTRYITVSAANISFNFIYDKIVIDVSRIITSFNIYKSDISNSLSDRLSTIIELSNNYVINNIYSKTEFDTSINRNYIRTSDICGSVISDANVIYSKIGYVDSNSVKKINVTLSNELLFPYAITYIDDTDEDPNIKEDYKIIQKKYKSTTTTTTAYTVTTRRIFKTTANPNTTTIRAEPQDINNIYLVMDKITSSNTSEKRKWYDSNGTVPLPAVFKKTVAPVNATTVTTFELNTDLKTWNQHKTHTSTTLTSGNVTYSLAVITNDTDNTTIKNRLPSNSSAWIGAQRIKGFSNTDLATGGSVTNDATYIYHTFTSSGINKFISKFNGTIEVLLVGGGGGGATARERVSNTSSLRHGVGGGGGGGGVVKLTSVTVVSGQSYDIVVGGGGPVGSNGTSSTAFDATAAGGGRGGGPGTTDIYQTLRAGYKGENGGSGGGAGYTGTDIGETFSGGSGNITNIIGSNNTGTPYWGNGAPGYYPWGYHRAGGGGGAGGSAPTLMGPLATNSSAAVGTFGAGGSGVTISFLPSPSRSVWGGGGGGGTIESGWQGGSVDPSGGGGQGGGGISTNSNGNGGGNGIANSGGGGGGGGGGKRSTDKPAGLGGAGGSGIVIIRYLRSIANEGGSSYWKWINDAAWSFTKWAPAEPGLDDNYAKIQTDGNWHDVDDNQPYQAIYMKKVYSPPVAEQTSLHFESTQRTWNQHIQWCTENSVGGTTYELASITDSTENDAIAAAAGNNSKIYIGGTRKSGSSATGTSGRSNTDWEWVDGTAWNNDYNNFYDGYSNTTYTYTTTYTQGSVTGSSTTTNLPGEHNVNTPYPPTYDSVSDISQTNVKLPLLVSSGNGSIVVTSTAIGVNSLPDVRPPETTSISAVGGFGPNDPDVKGPTLGATVNSRVVNSIELSTYQINTTGATQIGNSNVYRLPNITNDAYPNETPDDYIYKRFLKDQYDTYTYVNSYYYTGHGSESGTFKISENNNNNSYYKTATSTTIGTTYSCVAITNDGTFVALGKASNITVYMRTSTSNWSILREINNVDLSTYVNSNIIPDKFKKNIKNLAINYIAPILFLAYGDNKTSIKVYRYNITGTQWTQLGQVHSHEASSIAPIQSSNPRNFGYFVILSYSPSILGFTVDDTFHTFHCSYSNNISNNNRRGTVKRLPSSYNNQKNIIAFKMSSDAEKIIVSNTNYVYIYKWNSTDWDNIYYTSLVDPNTVTTGGPWSLDISNISANECVFAIGFPDKHILTSYTGSSGSIGSSIVKQRPQKGYVEYFKYSNSNVTKLATLLPRKRDVNIDSNDTNEYFFGAGGIKITNSNTIIVSPNYKFHFNNTNKNYLVINNYNSAYNESLASIENEVDNELIRYGSPRLGNDNYYIGGFRQNGSTNWNWMSNDIWNFEAWATNYPSNVVNNESVQINGLSRQWQNVPAPTTSNKAIIMTKTIQYSLNTFSIFNKFNFHSSGFFSSYYTQETPPYDTIIAKWKSASMSNPYSINIRSDGLLTRNSAITISDIRLKENIIDATPKLDDLLKVRVVNYNLKGRPNTKDNKLIGVVAQELEHIFPRLVNTRELSEENIKAGRTDNYKIVKYSCLNIMLIKAFQEQLAIIKKLTSRLDEVDNKCKQVKNIAQENAILNMDVDILKKENEQFKISINEILKLLNKDL